MLSRWRGAVLVLGALAILYLAVAVTQTVGDPKQWDLAVYRHAAAVIAEGRDPYTADAALPPRRAGEPALPFVYPPHVAAMLGFAAVLGDELPTGAAARRVDRLFVFYLAAKLAAIGLLLLLWQQFLSDPGLRSRRSTVLDPQDRAATFASLAFLAVMAFRETLLRDLYSGNISLFEQLALWLAFVFLLQRRWLVFSTLVALAAAAKLTLALFLPLSTGLMADHPPLDSKRPLGSKIQERDVTLWLGPSIALSLLLVVVLISQIATPWSVLDWWHAVSSLDERGRMNPCSLALWRDFAAILGLGATPFATAAWIVGSLLIALATARSIWRHRPTVALRLLIATTAVALVLPRFKDYSYVMLIPAAWWVLNHLRWRAGVGLLLLLLVHVWDYQPLLAAFVLWCCLLRLVAPANGEAR